MEAIMARMSNKTAGTWASTDVEICTGCLTRGAATVQALLPGAAVVLGMAAFGLVIHFA
jgi:hypothetical protein